MRPLASIIYTCFDRKELLVRSLQELNHQTVPPEDFEVIIGDDSAEIEISRSVLAEIEPKYKLSVVKSGLPYEVNGVSVARNKAIKAASAPIIISTDDDCIQSAFFIEEHLAMHHCRWPRIVLGYRSHDAEKLQDDRPVPVTERKSLDELDLDARDCLFYDQFLTGNISFPRDVVMDAGLFNEDFARPREHGFEDHELGYRFWRAGYPTFFAPNAVNYRPPTEKKKLKMRARNASLALARKRFVACHPLINIVDKLIKAFRERRYKDARKLAYAVLADDPENHGVLTLLGRLHMRMGEVDVALHDQRALAINSYHPVVHDKLGVIHYRRGDYDKAEEHLAKAVEGDYRRVHCAYLLQRLRERRVARDLKLT